MTFKQQSIDLEKQRQVVEALKRVLPGYALLWQKEDTIPYECDGLTAYTQRPMVVAIAQTEADVAQVLKVCHTLQVPVVSRGHGTGLSGGALPHSQGVTLSLAKLNRIVHLDALARIAIVQPGVRNLAISEAAAPYGLYYAPDPSSQIACSIGGNVAENAGGVHCLKYGLTLNNVLGVRGYTMEGEELSIGGKSLAEQGIDLLPAIVGSEGMLMVITEITVRLLPKPVLARCLLASFDSVAKAGEAVAGLLANGIIPAGLEMMDQGMTQAVEQFVHADYDLEAAAILLCELDGTAEAVAEELAHVSELLMGFGATRIKVSQNESERLKFWSGRKNAFPACGRISPDYLCMDGTIPRQHIADVLLAIESMQQRFGLKCLNVFHAGDGNLHPLILFNADDPEQKQRAESFGAEILETCIKFGGTITGEHGVGVEKLNSMCVQFERAELDLMFAVKKAFDKDALLNPGKVIPTLNRCAEYGKMVVHRGQTKFAEIERF